MKRIEKHIEAGEKPAKPMTSEQLVALGQMLSRRTQIHCGNCKMRISMTVEGGELRMGSSPDLSELNPAQKPKPRLIFYCSRCKRILGFVQGDIWSDDPEGGEPTRWDHLELEEL